MVLAWVDTARDDSAEGCPVLQQALAPHRRQEAAFTYPANYSSSASYTEGRTLVKPSMRCPNHVMGCQSHNDSSGGQGLFSDGFARREYADVVWGGEEGFSPSSTGDHPQVERPKHLFVGLQRDKSAGWQCSCGRPELLPGLRYDELIEPDEFEESHKKHFRTFTSEFDHYRFGTFPITNREIKIWMPLRSCLGSKSVFQAVICCARPSEPPAVINLALWRSSLKRGARITYFEMGGGSCSSISNIKGLLHIHNVVQLCCIIDGNSTGQQRQPDRAISRILDPEQSSLAHLPTRVHQHSGVLVYAQCVGNVRMRSHILRGSLYPTSRCRR